MLRDYLKYQGTIYLSEEDIQDSLKEVEQVNHRLKQVKSPTKEEEEEEEHDWKASGTTRNKWKDENKEDKNYFKTSNSVKLDLKALTFKQYNHKYQPWWK